MDIAVGPSCLSPPLCPEAAEMTSHIQWTQEATQPSPAIPTHLDQAALCPGAPLSFLTQFGQSRETRGSRVPRTRHPRSAWLNSFSSSHCMPGLLVTHAPQEAATIINPRAEGHFVPLGVLNHRQRLFFFLNCQESNLGLIPFSQVL